VEFGAPAGKAVWKVADVQLPMLLGLALNAFSDENIPLMAENLKKAVERKNEGDDVSYVPVFTDDWIYMVQPWISNPYQIMDYSDLAYRVLQNTNFPSWLYAVDQALHHLGTGLNGYTTDKGFGGTTGMNSFNHYTFGAIGQWMMAYSLAFNVTSQASRNSF
jgi:alpha-L-rhamnosidase